MINKISPSIVLFKEILSWGKNEKTKLKKENVKKSGAAR